MLAHARIPGIARGSCAVDHRIVASGEGLVAHGMPILGPFPDVAGLVEQAVTLLLEGTVGRPA